jgi:peptide/nickel transport system substrate-binding protein
MRTGPKAMLARTAAAGLFVGAALVGVAGSSSAAPHRPATPSGTAYWAEGAASPPNWILPFDSLQYFDQANINQFQQLMYRPLYWIGYDGQPQLNQALSLADAPVLSNGGLTATITLKHYRWSNGAVLDAQDVVFFMNMARSERNELGGYAPGEFPANVTSVTASSPTSSTVTFKFTQAYNTNWLVLNELAQITPMPLAWDIKTLIDGKPARPTSGGCSSMDWNPGAIRNCHAVWGFLTDDGGLSPHAVEAGDLATYATNPLWQVVDGPWHLTGFSDSSGEVTMEPNPTYSGPVKPSIAKFTELPFSSSEAEFNALAAGGTTAPDVGYLPLENAPAAPKMGVVGPNAAALVNSYNLYETYSWQTNYFPINFNSTGDGGAAGPIFNQLYIRQALTELVNQPGIIKSVDKNYAVDDDGPVPTEPATSYLSSAETDNPYPYSATDATTLLKAHGWTIATGQPATCSDASLCGAGIPTGTKLELTLVTASGSPELTATTDSNIASWQSAGIYVTNRYMPFDFVLETAAKCTPSQPFCDWEMANWGGGWLYEPDVIPTGDQIFASAAGSNSGSYSDPENDKLIADSLTSPSNSALLTWENYLTDQAPVIWQPTASGLTEVAKNLRGATPFNTLGSLNPENWSFAS